MYYCYYGNSVTCALRTRLSVSVRPLLRSQIAPNAMHVHVLRPILKYVKPSPHTPPTHLHPPFHDTTTPPAPTPPSHPLIFTCLADSRALSSKPCNPGTGPKYKRSKKLKGKIPYIG